MSRMGSLAQWRLKTAPILAFVAYTVLIVMGLYNIGTMLLEISDRSEQLRSAEDHLAKIQTPTTMRPGEDSISVAPPAGDIFMRADKLTVAAADLQRRVTSAIRAGGGNVLSAQIERQEAVGSNAGVDFIVECDIDQSDLQQLLYDLETTTPFLFIESLKLRTRGDASEQSSDVHLRASLRLTAFWRGSRP
jgi:general secretion pathway protein M